MYWDGVFPILFGIDEDRAINALFDYLQSGSDILENLPPKIRGDKPQLDLTAGRVSMEGTIAKMLDSISISDIRSALTCQWENKDRITSLGWDSQSVKFAYSIAGGKEPGSAPHCGVIAGQWLAAESLPITGMGEGGRRSYRWVTWSFPLDMGGIRAVVLSRSSDWGGVMYEARVARNGQMGYLEPARTISTGPNKGRFAND
ncbi:hypothetical protein [uncultured Desulfuromonas sp.]|uniref:hypothetical protein n=1 Tax=uncultured Desulfuromonas sp. TaxID=181013 RepID=UPI002AAB36FD|nr:hypothetical protein [uncultured Desulfuromonas sp.]